MIREVLKPETELNAFVQAGGLSFFKEGGLPGEFKPEVFRKNWTNLINMGIGKMWLLDIGGMVSGGLGALVTDDINDGAKVLTECFWYVVPEHRGSLQGAKLFYIMEGYAASVGVKRIMMVHYHSTMDYRLPEFYQKNGYRPIETHYVKELWPSPQPQL